jgi:hypothetical protein
MSFEPVMGRFSKMADGEPVRKGTRPAGGEANTMPISAKNRQIQESQFKENAMVD